MLPPITPCPGCIKRGKTWEGADPICGFPHGVFTTRNWNCATLNALRDMADVTYSDENRVGVVPYHINGSYIILMWYKSRGAIMQALWWTDNQAPSSLTLRQAKLVLDQDQF